jgi:phage-related baseplate assembly protein
MTTLPTQSFATIVQNIAAGVQGRAGALINFAIGSTLRAIAEGFAGVVLWLQTLILQLLLTTRAATSTGSDLDTFVADFGVTRLGAQAATGQVTYSRLSASTSTPFIPVGSTINTVDGTQTFTVSIDATNAAYSASLGGYTMPSMTTALTVPVIASVAGSGGNISANALSQSTTPITGIDLVTNSAAFTNGADAESDAALRVRFQAFILGLARGDHYGLAYAITSLAVSVEYSLVENYGYAGNYAPGSFYVVCDDGSGSPSAAFVASVAAAVQSVRPLGTVANVFATVAVATNVSMTLTTAAGYTHANVVAQVAASVGAGLASISQGAGLQYGDLYFWAFSVPGVTGVNAVLLNGSSGDAASIAANPQKTLVAGVVTIS